ncbi:YfiR family protein [Massilia sp. CF038]|uniref:YfiR family protein n=1 Tax=Massilia sp. CF038 TaxID=1881045 RepID=UPI000932CC74|nr:YfiR family protein [Massilia sp. CF038]
MDTARAPRGARRRFAAAALALAALAVTAGRVHADAPGPANASSPSLERKVKAAFLYKFLGYAEFPANAFSDASAPLVIGVVGADELAAELTRIVSGRSVQSRPIVVKVFAEGEAPAGVHLLFIGGSDSAHVKAVLKAAQPAPMLLVSEAENGLQLGSVINFKIVDERVRFDVSLEAADKNSVKLSSRLLTVANQVHKGSP